LERRRGRARKASCQADERLDVSFFDVYDAPVMVESLASDLSVFHRVITRAMTVSLARARGFEGAGFESPELKRGFLDYVRCLTILTKAHHDTEDELVFPTFRARLPDAPFDTLDAQHTELLPLLDSVRERAESGGKGVPESEWLPGLARDLERLGQLWAEHIGLEERYFTDEVVGPVCPPAEQAELSRKFAEHGQKLAQPGPLLLPFMYFNLEPADRRNFSGKLPPPVVQQLIPLDWREIWAPMKPFLLA
jgi:hypothetical protein